MIRRAQALARYLSDAGDLISEAGVAGQDLSQVPTGSVRVEHFFTIAEVAEMFRVSGRTVRRWIKNGAIQKAAWPGRNVIISSWEIADLFGHPEV